MDGERRRTRMRIATARGRQHQVPDRQSTDRKESGEWFSWSCAVGGASPELRRAILRMTTLGTDRSRGLVRVKLNLLLNTGEVRDPPILEIAAVQVF